MQPMHIEEEILDQYATGGVSEDLLPQVEEHLLICQECQGRLAACDDFVRLIRIVTSEIELSPVSFWKKVFGFRLAQFATAAAILAVSVASIEVSRRHDRAPEATVLLESLRGPDAGARVSAGQPFRLVFDLPLPADGQKCKVQILNREGTNILETGASQSEDRLVASVARLARGDYWTRVYCGEKNELIAEYSLTSN
jgi:hypothetical protein